jgi:hypothetical protein
MPKISELPQGPIQTNTVLPGDTPIGSIGTGTFGYSASRLASFIVGLYTDGGPGVPNSLVMYDSAGKYPAADGHAITNLNIAALGGSLTHIKIELGGAFTGIPASGIEQAMYVTQNYAPATLTKTENYNLFAIVDGFTYAGAIFGWTFIHNLVGGGGDRASMCIETNVAATPTNPPGHNEIACLFLNMKAVGIDAGNTHLFAFNPQCVIGPGTSNVPHVSIIEINGSIASDTVLPLMAYLAFVPNDAAGAGTIRGSQHTTAQIFYSEVGTAGFSELFLIGAWDTVNQSPFGQNGVARGGSVMTTVRNPSIKFGIDFSGAVPVGADGTGAPFISPDFRVDWVGNVGVNSISYITYTGAAINFPDDNHLNVAFAGAGPVFSLDKFGDLAIQGVMVYPNKAYSALPAGSFGYVATINDGAPGLALGAVVSAGGGSPPTKYLLWHNGTNWKVIGT